MSIERECRCLELEERVSKAELETELQKRNKEFESLEQRYKESEEELVEQMMVTTTVEYEKQVAEKEAKDWKRKFETLVDTFRKLDEIGALRELELESLDENVKLGLGLAKIKLPIPKKTESCQDDLNRKGLAYHQISGLPYITTPVKDYMVGRDRDDASSRRRVKKMLVFDDDGRKSVDVVVLSDSDAEERSEKESDGVDTLEERSVGENYEDEDCEVNTNTPLGGRKRKRVITSDSENNDAEDEDDNIPIAILKNLKPVKQETYGLVDSPPSKEENEPGRLKRQRRVSSRLREKRVVEESFTSRSERLVGIQTTDNAEDDETEEEEESGSESNSLDGFIVPDEITSEKSDETGGDDDAPPEEDDTVYVEVMSRLRRDKKPKDRNWEYEADMLADFGKDPELCMRAVCVLYRFQTEDEKLSRTSHVTNSRGFNKLDAKRGTRIGQFLTDKDPEGDLVKTVEELESFDFEAVEVCGELARRYSKQLFEIYNNREDPFFFAPPSP
ncbi:unnamed protein product [Microthlaspi erraticum]|uniref:Uncharacterized protein n=1 Tax=Microthlaspi erraticum TaxID=1685480 RepID=A0A6D2KIC3_9BRAS|nr:unnamed protein product [Microthlaspi erraticum]